MRSIFLKILTLLGLVFLCTRCNDNTGQPVQQIEDTQLIEQYLTDYPQTAISVKDPIILRFRSDKLMDIDAEQIQGVKIKPSVEGQFRWDGSRLMFVPQEILDYNTSYSLIIDPNQLLKIDESTAPLTIGVNTMPLSLSIWPDGLKMAIEDQQEKISYVGYIESSDYIPYHQLEPMLKAVQDGSSLPIFWNHDNRGRRHAFTIEKVRQTDNPTELILSWSGKKYDPKFVGEETITIAPKSKFGLDRLDLSDSPQRIIELTFTRPVDTKQDLNGLISINEYSNELRTEIEGNRIYIYPPELIDEDFSIYVSDKLKSIDGTYMDKENLFNKLRFKLMDPAVRAIGSGTIVPHTDQVTFPVEAVNLNQLQLEVFKIYSNNMLQYLQENNLKEGHYLSQVGQIIAKESIAIGNPRQNEWVRVGIDLSKYIASDQSALYQVRVGFSYGDATTDCEEKVSAGEQSNESIMQYSSDFYRHYQERNNPCHSAYYNPDRYIQRNVLSSDIGAIVKGDASGDYHIAVSNISSGEPVGQATISFYSYQQQLLGEVQSSANGQANIDVAEPASFCIVQSGPNYGYLKLDDQNSNSLTEFDVNGVNGGGPTDMFVYTDRGVYRPGDTIYMYAMINGDAMDSRANHPLTLDVKDPKGKSIYERISTNQVGGIYDFVIPSDGQDLTGRYVATLDYGPHSFTKVLRIETIKPNRLKIGVEAPEILRYDQKNQRNIDVTANWLHGAVATSLDVTLDATFKNKRTSFKGMEDYSFVDPARKGSNGFVRILDGKLSEDGAISTTLKIDPEIFPGMVQAELKTRVFEPGGSFSERYAGLDIHPFSHYVGVNAPESRWGSKRIKIGEEATFKIAAVDQEGQKAGRRRISIGLYDIAWQWWYYEGDRYNIYKLNSKEHSESFFEKTTVTDVTGAYDFTYDFQDIGYGRKLIRVCDLESGHCTGQFFYASSYGAMAEDVERQSLSKLNFKSSQNSYEIGELIRVKIPSEEGSRILISVESGHGVLHQEWVIGQADKTVYEIEAHQSMLPNIYVHATMIQSYDDKQNDLPIRMYGVVPIIITDADKVLEPVITMADQLEPEQTFSISVSEQNDQPMSYTIAVVDEGLLDLTNFNTPDPHGHFYAKQALNLKTWDVYNDVLTGFNGDIDQLISVGGDGENDDPSGAKKAIRFKPVVLAAGPFYLQSGQTSKHQFTMPNYVGSVRAMVIAKDVDSYGHIEKTALVRQPLMILPSAPRKLSPGEKTKVAVTVFAMEDHVKDVEVRMLTSNGLTIEGTSAKNVRFERPGEKVVYFEINVADFRGIGNLQFEARASGLVVTQQIELDIVNPNPLETIVVQQAIEPGANWEQDLVGFERPDITDLTLEVSTMPDLNITKRLDYLIKYPYGCIEQTTSAAFAQLYIKDIADLSPERKSSIDKNINAAIRRIVKMQNVDGGFVYWPGGTRSVSWGSSYAGYFLTEAQSKGYYVPSKSINSWISYQKKQSRIKYTNEGSSRNHHSIDQAYRLMALAASGNEQLSQMNVMRVSDDMPSVAKYMLAAAYAYAGKNNIAVDLLQNVQYKSQKYTANNLTYGSDLRDMALVATCLMRTDRNTAAADLIKRIISQLNSSNWYSTQTTAQSLMAISRYIQKNSNADGMTFKVTAGDVADQTVNSDKAVITLQLNPQSVSKPILISNLSDQTLFAKVISTGQKRSENISEQKAVNQNISLDVKYTNLDGTPIDIISVERGTDFIADVTINNQKSRGSLIKNLALSQIFPSGWEVQRVSNLDNVLNEDSYDYRDVRDDRVLTFFDLIDKKQFKILLSASYEGKYWLPPVLCEAMYDHDIRGTSKALSVKVVEP